MNITEFARSRNVEPQTVRHYINSHPDIKELTSRRGKEVILSDEAVELLDVVYPLPQPVQVIQGVPHEEFERLQNRLVELQTSFINLQNSQIEDKVKLARMEALEVMLEDRDRQIESYLDERQTLQNELKRLNERLNEFQPTVLGLYRKKPLKGKIEGSDG